MLKAGLATALALGLAAGHAGAAAVEAGDVAWGCEDAGYARPVDGPAGRPAHRALFMLVHTDFGVIPATLDLPAGQVYTGPAPLCADLDGDGEAEVVAAQHGPAGGWLTVYGKRTGPIVSSVPVPGGVVVVGAVDMDGEGPDELAWIEGAGGAGRLRVAGLRDGALVEIASADGFAGHRPDGTAAAGVNACVGDGDALILPATGRSGLIRVRLAAGRLVSEPVPDGTDEGAIECAGAQQGEKQ